MRWLLAIIFSLVFAVAAGLWWLERPNLNDCPMLLEVERGDTLSRLASEWQAEGWLQSALALKLVARLEEVKDIRPGEFQVPAGVTNRQLLVLLLSAKPKSYRIALIEGRPVREAIRVLANAPFLTQDLGELSEKTIKEFLEIDGSLEGLLYPDTYVYSKDEKVSTIIQQAHQRLNQVLAEEWAQREEDLPYASAYEALVMASIVEKETGVDYERPMIAGVFVRRLNKNMRMETDPTVIYGLGSEFEGNLTRRHLRDSSNPYNTYRHKGLPPGPIALAGREAIHAALHPQAGSELFFVAKGDGSHYFSTTLSEHNRAVIRYQLNRREDYRSSPAPQKQAGTE